MKRLLTLVLLATLWLPFAAWSEQVSGLYSVTVPVTDQSSASLRQGLQLALQEVLLKVTVGREALDNPQVHAAMRRPQSYVRQYSYSTVQQEDDKDALFLNASFERRAIRELMREAQMPMWASNRPNVLIWLAVDDARERQLAGADTLPEIYRTIREKAQQRGLPITMPLLDLEDGFALGVDDVWRFNAERLLSASQRYPSDGILAGRVAITTTGKWIGSWWFFYQGKSISFDGQGQDVDAYIAYGIDYIADRLAKQYAISPLHEHAGRVQLVLQGVESFSDYAQALRYLQGLVATREVQVAEVDGDVVRFDLKVEGDLSQLQSVIALDKKLQLSAEPPEADDQNRTALYYHWR